MTIGDLIKIFPAIASWAVGSLLIFYLVIPIEKFLHPRVKLYLCMRLKNPRAVLPYRRLISALLRAFDSVFRFKKSTFGLYLPSPVRSALVTIVFSIALILILSSFYGWAAFFISIIFEMAVHGLPSGFPIEGNDLFELRGHEIFFKDENRKIMLCAFMAFLVSGIFVDYVALVQTRSTYGKMLRSHLKSKVLLLLIDILIKIFIATFGITSAYILNQFLLSVFFDVGDAIPFTLDSFLVMAQWGDQVFKEMAAQILCSVSSYEYCSETHYKEYPVLFIYSTLAAPFFLSAFFTSIWVWIYFLAFSTFRLFYALRPIHLLIDFLVDIEKEPFKAVSLVLFFLWSLCCLVAWVLH